MPATDVPDQRPPGKPEGSISSPTSPNSNGAGAQTSKTPSLSAATLNSMDVLDDKNSLEAGDTISYRVLEDRDDAVTRTVTDTGEIDVPYAGRVKVEGKTCHQVALEVKKLLEVDLAYYKHATVIVGLDVIAGQDKTKPRDLVWVIGEVRQVGPQEISKLQPMTVSQIILKAGGFTDYADQRNVRVFHNLGSDSNKPPPPNLADGKTGVSVDVKAAFQGHSTSDPVVQPGDYIYVNKSFF